MNTKIISKGMDLSDEYLDDFIEFLGESECGYMSIPILKKRVRIPIKDDLDPSGYRLVSINEWMPLGSLYEFRDTMWIPIED